MISDRKSLQKNFVEQTAQNIHRYFEEMKEEKEFDFNEKRKANLVLFKLWMKMRSAKLARER
jgi:hypothetical protein